MTDFVSVIIPTHNPDISRLNQVMEALKLQDLPRDQWELIIVDNNSSSPVTVNLSWHLNSRMIAEPKTGLTHARMRGFFEAGGDLLVLVDDDNILGPGYLSQIINIFNDYTALGAIGGKSLPDFEAEPPIWVKQFYGNLALRDLGDNVITEQWNGRYPEASPIGAGIAIRKTALQSYISKINTQDKPIMDREGKSLGSGGDNDMVLEVLKAGWGIGYFPSLILHHIIPEERMQVEYLARLVNNINKSWIMLLENHEINPWQKVAGWTVPLRKVKAWLTYKAWLNKVNYIKWRGACGTFDGLSRKTTTK